MVQSAVVERGSGERGSGAVCVWEFVCVYITHACSPCECTSVVVFVWFDDGIDSTTLL